MKAAIRVSGKKTIEVASFLYKYRLLNIEQ